MSVSLHFQPSQGQPNAARWVLSTSVGDEKDPAFTLEVRIQHDYSGDEHRPEVYVFKDGAEYRVRSDAEHKQVREDIAVHEGEEEADGWEMNGNVSESYARIVWGWGTQDAVKDILKRWDAIQLIINPAVTW